MIPRIITLKEKKLIGICSFMSFSNNRTAELWKNFMARRKEILNPVETDLYSLQIYGNGFFEIFNPNREFVKWAAIEVNDFDNIPEGMKSFILQGGSYAVFHYKGLAGNSSVFQYILGEWLPKSEYTLDNRPHFEVLGEKYKNNDPDSEEKIWIPILPKT